MFIYIKGTTSKDDIIEHILMLLNTEFEGACLTVSDFCYNQDTDESRDYNMSMSVMAEMYEHQIAKECTGQGKHDYDIELIAKGVQIYKNGGWKKYIKEYNNVKAIDKKQDDDAKTWDIWSNRATVFATLFGVISFCWGYFESRESKKKDIEIKQLQDSLTVMRKNNQVFLQSIVQDSSLRQYPKQKYDSLKHSKKQ